ncbi:MAG: hypothetical protein HOY78_02265 [Saccharothrix sp.]|nr:hypothetical protein [Saccharothrix sp.]
MTSPDASAAAFDPEDTAPADLYPLAGEIDERHIGAVLCIGDEEATLVGILPSPPGMATFAVRREGEDSDRIRSYLAAQPVQVVESAPQVRPDTARMLDREALSAKARELARLTARIKDLEIELPALRRRKAELAGELLEPMVLMDGKPWHFDDRRLYLFPVLVPEFEQREDGTRYTVRDLAPVLRALGYHDAVKPEEAGHNALLRIFRDHAKDEKPLPPQLAAMVSPRTVHEVRVGVGRGSRAG